MKTAEEMLKYYRTEITPNTGSKEGPQLDLFKNLVKYGMKSDDNVVVAFLGWRKTILKENAYALTNKRIFWHGKASESGSIDIDDVVNISFTVGKDDMGYENGIIKISSLAEDAIIVNDREFAAKIYKKIKNYIKS